MSDEEDLKRIFFLECEELLGNAEQSVEALRGEAAPQEAINALFRAVHSIKGGAGAFGIDRLAKFAHAFESFMDRLRKGRAELDEASLDLLFDGVDVLRLLVEEARDGTPAPPARYDAALAGLRQAAGLEDEPEDEGESETLPAVGSDAGDEVRAPTTQYRIRFAPGPRLMTAGIDPLRILRAIKALGDVSVEVDASRVPGLAELDPSVCLFAWTVTLDTAAPRADLDEIGEMIDDLATVEIEMTSEPEPEPPPGTSLVVPEASKSSQPKTAAPRRRRRRRARQAPRRRPAARSRCRPCASTCPSSSASATWSAS